MSYWFHHPFLAAGTRRRGIARLGLVMSGDGGGGGFRHLTVMPDEVTAALRPEPGRRYLDLTLGGGGHSERLLQEGAAVLGVDRDAAALAAATTRLAGFGPRFRTLRSNFADFAGRCGELGEQPFDGILMDLGVSSHQLDTAERGFSFMRDGPLDMRMGTDEPVTAADLVNGSGEEELIRIFRTFGEEPQAKRAARAIVAACTRQPMTTTRELADCVEQALGRRSGHHPATKIFQALRIAVNGELAALEQALAATKDWLAPGGRLAVISFHSLEDRITKQFIRAHAKETIDRPEWPEARPNPECWLLEIGRKAREASPAEINVNPRARSAKLRVAERRAA